MESKNTQEQYWQELMNTFDKVGLDEIPKLLGTQKEFESACIPRQDSLEMLTEGESVITRNDNHIFDECPSGIENINADCGGNYNQMDSFLMQEENIEFNASELVFKALFNLHIPKIICLSDGKYIPTRKNKRK